MVYVSSPLAATFHHRLLEAKTRKTHSSLLFPPWRIIISLHLYELMKTNQPTNQTEQNCTFVKRKISQRRLCVFPSAASETLSHSCSSRKPKCESKQRVYYTGGGVRRVFAFCCFFFDVRPSVPYSFLDKTVKALTAHTYSRCLTSFCQRNSCGALKQWQMRSPELQFFLRSAFGSFSPYQFAEEAEIDIGGQL